MVHPLPAGPEGSDEVGGEGLVLAVAGVRGLTRHEAERRLAAEQPEVWGGLVDLSARRSAEAQVDRLEELVDVIPQVEAELRKMLEFLGGAVVVPGAAWNDTYWTQDRFETLRLQAKSELDAAKRADHERAPAIGEFRVATTAVRSDDPALVLDRSGL